jgi:hypothetical protein
MKNVKHAVRWLPKAYVFLIPVYFILHNYYLYHQQIPFSLLKNYLLFWLLLPFMIVACLSFLMPGKRKTVNVLASFLLFLYFFFGPAYDVLRLVPYVKMLTKISVILVLTLTASISLVLYRRKIQMEQSRIPSLLYLIFITLIFIESLDFFFFHNRLSVNDKDLKRVFQLDSGLSMMKHKPDIYHFIFDELSQTKAAANFLKYDNRLLDSSLKKRGFFIASNSQSAYIQTPFSIASTFQASVFSSEHEQRIGLMDYQLAYHEIRQNQSIPYLIRNGYHIHNLAEYKIYPDEPDSGNADPVNNIEQIVINQTYPALMYELINRAVKDKLSNFFENDVIRNRETLLAQKQMLDKIKRASDYSSNLNTQPDFIHMHLNAPHLPGFFDSIGKPWSAQTVKAYRFDTILHNAYKVNMAFTRKVILELVEKIQVATNGQAIIIIQSDHGYRGSLKYPVPDSIKYKNFMAIYYPDQDYRWLDQDFFLPNTFRVLLKKYTDSTIMLTPTVKKPIRSSFIDD